MSKKEKLYLGFLAFLLLVLIWIRYTAPRPLDWTPTLSREDSIPFGTYALYELLDDLFPEQEKITIRTTLGEFENALVEGEAPTTEITRLSDPKNLIFIAEECALDTFETRLLLEQVAEGSHAFIAANAFSIPLRSQLNFEIRSMLSFFEYNYDKNYDSLGVQLVNPKLQPQTDRFFYSSKNITGQYISNFDSLSHTVLAVNEEGLPVYLEIPWGDGTFLVHANPLIFSNYSILKERNEAYVSAALSYLPNGLPIVWDELANKGRNESRTPLRFILQQPPLKWAWYISFAMVLLILFFNGKRRQRAIPIVKPPSNDSLEFIETMGQLYYQNGNHHDLAVKKIKFFKDHLRSALYFQVENWDDPTQKRLAERLGMPPKELTKLFRLINLTQQRETLTEEELILIFEQIERFNELIRLKRKRIREN